MYLFFKNTTARFEGLERWMLESGDESRGLDSNREMARQRESRRGVGKSVTMTVLLKMENTSSREVERWRW